MKTAFVLLKNADDASLRSFTDSGIISIIAVASMKPAPSAMKYFRKCPDHCRCEISSPPSRFAPAATMPSSSANKIRIASGECMDLSAVPEQNHVAILHDVLFSFQPHLRLFTRRRETPGLQQVLPIHHVRLDEILLDVAMDRPGRLLRVHSAFDGPRAAFRFAAGE